MRVIAKRTLREFWEQGCGDAETPLTEWCNMMQKAPWATPQELKADRRSASVLRVAASSSTRDLESFIGSSGRVSEVLSASENSACA